MPTPNTGVAVSRPDLGVIAHEYADAADQRGYIGDIVMPEFGVPEASGEYPIIPTKAMLEDRETQRAPRSGYSRSDFKFDMGGFTCRENGTEEPLDDREKRLYKRLFDAEEVATQRATDVVKRRHEQRVATKVMAPGNAGTSLAVTTAWSDTVNANPREDVRQAKEQMRYNAGFMPNALVVSYKVFENLVNCDALIKYLQPTSAFLLENMEAQKAILARYLNVPRVLVGDALKDSAKKGKDFILEDVWSDQYAALMKLSDGGMNLQEPCFGRTFVWDGDSGMLTVESYRDESVRSDIYRARQDTDEGIVFKGANLLLTGVTA